MNLTVMVVEQLDWDAQLRTLTFRPQGGADLWVARLDEYDNPRSGPFHLLDRDQELDFAYRFERAPQRKAGRFVEHGRGEVEFKTEWHGIPTGKSGVSSYAICLPKDAVPDVVEFSDPRQTDHFYQHYASFDPQMGRVVCYLECRSRYGSFDFDLSLKFHRNAQGCRSFKAVYGGPGIAQLRRISECIGSDEDKVLIQQFFDGSKNFAASDGSLILDDSNVRGPIVTAGAASTIGAVGDSSHGYAQGALSELGIRDSDVQNVGKNLVERAKSSLMIQVLGFVTLATAVIATALIFLGVTNIAIAGYGVALISLVAASVPLLRG